LATAPLFINNCLAKNKKPTNHDIRRWATNRSNISLLLERSFLLARRHTTTAAVAALAANRRTIAHRKHYRAGPELKRMQIFRRAYPFFCVHVFALYSACAAQQPEQFIAEPI